MRPSAEADRSPAGFPVEPLRFDLEDGTALSGLLQLPDEPPEACFVFAHGAGAGMHHPFMAALAEQLASRGIATLRYQFPFTERGSKRPDPPAVAHAAVRAAVACAAARLPDVPRFAGGKSFGGRMTSQAQAAAALPGVAGLVFVGFPLHPAAKPSSTRGDHLQDVDVPMLFLQGTRDALAELPLVQALVQRLARRATLAIVDGADHSFSVPRRSGRSGADVIDRLAQTAAAWMTAPADEAGG